MKNKITGFILLLIGIGIGYGISYFTGDKVENPQFVYDNFVKDKNESKNITNKNSEKKLENKKNITNVNNDTIHKKSGKSDNLTSVNDTSLIEINNTDSIFLKYNYKGSEFILVDDDTISDDIIKEVLISQRTFFLKPVPIDSTDVSELLNLKSESFSQEISIEFWQSPINITGYELTRNKLKLFGFNPNESFDLQLSNDKEHLFLNMETMSIILHKTNRFQSIDLK